MIGGRGEEKVHHYMIFAAFSSLVHETIVPINLLKVIKMKTKMQVFKIKRNKALFTMQGVPEHSIPGTRIYLFIYLFFDTDANAIYHIVCNLNFKIP